MSDAKEKTMIHPSDDELEGMALELIDPEYWIKDVPPVMTEAAAMLRACKGSSAHSDERDSLRDYAHEATKVITGLAGGGSELFGDSLGDFYKADLDRCVAVVRERLDRAHDRHVKAVKERNALLAASPHPDVRELDEGAQMKIAQTAYNLGRKAEAAGYVARDPRVILSQTRAALATQDDRDG